jgi:hypothetical protein
MFMVSLPTETVEWVAWVWSGGWVWTYATYTTYTTYTTELRT